MSRLIPSQRNALDATRNIVLRAGAGSGKTTVLVERYLRLLEFGLSAPDARHAAPEKEAAPLAPEEILALTFTRKAAAEMRERAMARLAERLEQAPASEKPAWRARRDAMDRAFIGTIHGFCKQTLEEFSLRAGLDPGFEVAEDFVFRQLRDQAIADIFEEGGETGDESVNWLAKHWERGEAEAALKAIFYKATAFHDIFPQSLTGLTLEQVEEGLFGTEAKPTLERLGQLIAEGGPVARFRDGVRNIFERAGVGHEGTPFGDFSAALDWARAAVAANNRAGSIVALDEAIRAPLTAAGTPYKRSGHFANFYGFKKSEAEGQKLAAAEEGFYEANADVLTEAFALVERLPSKQDLEFAPDVRALLDVFGQVEERLREMLDERFLVTQDDLLLKTRNLLRSDREVAAALGRRYRQIMVDEFQDTDPIQWEIVRVLASRNDVLSEAKLFVVGDEKQSIYRFRGADVAVFREAERAALGAGGRSLSLSDNFRTLPSVLEAINRLFANLLAPVSDDGKRQAYEAEPQALQAGAFAAEMGATPVAAKLPEKLAQKLAAEAAEMGEAPPILDYEAWRRARPDLGSVRFGLYKPWVDEEEDISSDDEDAASDPDERERQRKYRELEGVSPGEAAARAVLWALGRTAGGPKPPLIRDGDGQDFSVVRPAGPGDIMVLLQARTSLAQIERAFRHHQIDYIVESGLGFFRAQEIYDLRNCLAFLADPRDDVSLAGVLRGPLMGLPDDVLALLALREGETWRDKLRSLRAMLEDDANPSEDAEAARALLGADGVAGVLEAVRLLDRWLDIAPHLPLADLVQTIAEESGALAAFAQGNQGQQRVANVDKLAEMARDFERVGLRGVGAFVTYLDEMEADPSVREGLAEVGDVEAGGRVRVATVHGSKGREAPVIIVADTDRWRSPSGDPVRVLREQAGDAVRNEFAIRPPSWYRTSEAVFKRLGAVGDEIAKREEAESRRLFYVAATRARDHLVFVGRAVAQAQRQWTHWLFEFAGEKAKERSKWLQGSLIEGRWLPVAGGAPAFLEAIEPMALHGWRLLPPSERPAAETVPAPAKKAPEKVVAEVVVSGGPGRPPVRRIGEQLDLFPDQQPEVAPAGFSVFEGEMGGAERVAAIREGGPGLEAPFGTPVPWIAASQAGELVFEISPSAAGLLEADPSAYYLKAVLGAADPTELGVKKPARSLDAAELGSLVHRAFQEGIETPEAARELAFREAAGLGLFREDLESREEIDRAARIVERSVRRFREESDLGRRLAAWQGTMRREEPIALKLGPLLFEGRLDLLALPADKNQPALLIDFKTSRVEGVSTAPPSDRDEAIARLKLLEERAEHSGYLLQLALYALALERAGEVGSLELVVYYTRYAETVSRPWSAIWRNELLDRAGRWADRLFRGDFQRKDEVRS
jgi:ATP-dependent helicase/nuclease subunit A